MEGDANTNSTSLKIQKAEKVALRTVPAILKHGKKRLESSELKLAKNPEIAESYQKVVEEYLEKNYIR